MSTFKQMFVFEFILNNNIFVFLILTVENKQSRLFVRALYCKIAYEFVIHFRD